MNSTRMFPICSMASPILHLMILPSSRAAFFGDDTHIAPSCDLFPRSSTPTFPFLHLQMLLPSSLVVSFRDGAHVAPTAPVEGAPPLISTYDWSRVRTPGARERYGWHPFFHQGDP